MIRAVLDTNVLFSGILGFEIAQSTPGELVRRWDRNEFRLIVSEHILSELARAFTDRYVTSRLDPDQIAAMFRLLRLSATVQPLTVHVRGVATQPKDDLVLAAAISARADYLVTGDHPLQGLVRLEGVSILSPRQFLELLEAEPTRE
ncbi:MAG: putative toxin-antitoxin system toxin component, PIN family [Thermomicrobiales bacterium]